MDSRPAIEFHSVLFPTAWGWCGVCFTLRGLAALQLPIASRSKALELWRGTTETRRSLWLEHLAASDDRFRNAIRADRRNLDCLGERIESQVREYFEGKRRDFDLPLDWTGATPFRREVWTAAQDIPFGTTIAYGALARAIGRCGAARAVGGALGANPTPLVVPCHRVRGASGDLTGFSAEGGMDLKRRMIEFETAVAAR